MLKKNTTIILIIGLALLLIGLVIWFFHHRIEQLDHRQRPARQQSSIPISIP